MSKKPIPMRAASRRNVAEKHDNLARLVLQMSQSMFVLQLEAEVLQALVFELASKSTWQRFREFVLRRRVPVEERYQQLRKESVDRYQKLEAERQAAEEQKAQAEGSESGNEEQPATQATG